jgi:hypothetical protein
MRKMCSVYFRGNSIYIFGLLYTAYGWIEKIPAVIVDLQVDPKLLGEMVLNLLNQGPDMQQDVNLRKSGEEYETYIRALGFKNYNSFARNLKLVSVTLANNIVTVAPQENSGRGAFLPSDIPEMRCASTAEEIGRVVLEQKSKLDE